MGKRVDGASNSVTQVVDGLREAIKIGRYSPGHRLTEVELTEAYGVSRGPVREALGRLESEGLIEITRHRGATVRQMTRENVAELFVAREILEGGAARLAAGNIDVGDHRAQLEHQMRETVRLAEAEDGRAYADANEAFHGLIIAIAGNSVVGGLAEQLQTRTQRILYVQFISLARVRASAAHHERIANAILAGQGDRAEKAMRRHIRETAADVLSSSDAWFR